MQKRRDLSSYLNERKGSRLSIRLDVRIASYKRASANVLAGRSAYADELPTALAAARNHPFVESGVSFHRI